MVRDNDFAWIFWLLGFAVGFLIGLATYKVCSGGHENWENCETIGTSLAGHAIMECI